MELFIAWLVWLATFVLAVTVSAWLLIDPDQSDNTEAEESIG